MPERITVNNIIPALRNLSFFLLVIAVDIGVILSTIYIESGGAKLALPNLKWPKEIIAFFDLIGIPSNYLTPPTVLGAASSLLLFIGTYLIIHYAIGIIGSIQKVLPRIVQRREGIKGIDELYSLIQPAIVIMIIGVLLHGFVFNFWLKPLAQLQVARTFWPSDFQVVIQGDSIQTIKQVTPDMNAILQKHEGEFLKSIAISFPFVILFLHLVASVLTEIFFLHMMMSLGNFEARHIEIIKRIRWRLIELYRGIRTAIINIASYIRRFRNHQTGASHPLSRPEIPNEATIPASPIEVMANREGNIQTETTPNFGEEIGSRSEETEAEDIPPEDQPVRVIGGGETITPATAMLYPEIYTLENEKDNRTGRVSYIVYTREFYERLQKQERS